MIIIDAHVHWHNDVSLNQLLGAAWRNVRDGKQFERVLEMISGIDAMGLEVCCTLGMLTPYGVMNLPFSSNGTTTFLR